MSGGGHGAAVRRGALVAAWLIAGCSVGNSGGEPTGRSDGTASLTGGATAGGATTDAGGGTAGGGGTGGGSTAGGGTSAGAPPGDAQAAAVHFVGRFVADPTTPGAFDFAWSASTLLAQFDGPAATLTLNELTGANGNYYDVSVDGGAPRVLVTQAGQHDYPLAQGLASGPHGVRVRRRTEARNGVSQFVAFSAPGGQTVPFTRQVTRTMWIIGDSISCGYGIEGATPTCSYSEATESASETYGVVAADTLAADVHVTAWAGEGVYRNDGGVSGVLMPALAQLALPPDPNSTWDPNAFVPQVVVINLGTNDFAASIPPMVGFTQAYTALVENVRAMYPAAYVICALGPMLSDSGTPSMALSTARAYVTGVVHGFNDPSVVYLEFPALTDSSQEGCQAHPNVAAQASMGAQLAQQVSELTGWQPAAAQ